MIKIRKLRINDIEYIIDEILASMRMLMSLPGMDYRIQWRKRFNSIINACMDSTRKIKRITGAVSTS